jgi:uncharacterized protein (DUF433 family)
MAGTGEIDWSDCPLVETNPRVQSGAPVLRGTRLPVSAVMDNYEYGMDAAEIAFQFQVSQEAVESILTYAQSHRIARPIR